MICDQTLIVGHLAVPLRIPGGLQTADLAN